MIGVQTFWLHEFDENWHSWRSKQDLMVSCSLSFFLLKKHFNITKLVCNELGRIFMVEELGLPFDRIEMLDIEDSELNEFVWSIKKLYAYSVQDEPFIHIDTDFFMFEKPSHEYLNSQIFAQNLEINHPIYASIRSDAVRFGLQLPNYVISEERPAVALNVGIVGGQNIKFFKEFYFLAKNIVEENASSLEIYAEKFYFFYIFLEQYILYEFIKSQRIDIRTLVKPSFKLAYDHITQFYATEGKRPFVHLIGKFKQNTESLNSMHKELKDLWPEQYDYILSLS